MASLEFIEWSDIKNDIEKVNIELYNRVMSLDGQLPKFVLAKYNFGENIVHDGGFCNSEANEYLLNYQQFPLGILLEKHCSEHFHLGNDIYPTMTYKPGDMIGLRQLQSTLFEYELPKNDNYCISVGSRIVVSVYKLTDSKKIENLCEYCGKNLVTPKTWRNHYKLFSDITSCEREQEKWQARILFFTKEWIDKLIHPQPSHHYCDLYNFLIKACFLRSDFKINKLTNSIFHWHDFSNFLKSIGIKPNVNVVEVIGAIIEIAWGAHSGLRFAGTDDYFPR
ncbi:hypothetical protein OAO18_09405, partial [Francisellaceae bacterium]|nr:hypothetical protein [Francisellaceae bacterium]